MLFARVRPFGQTARCGLTTNTGLECNEATWRERSIDYVSLSLDRIIASVGMYGGRCGSGGARGLVELWDPIPHLQPTLPSEFNLCVEGRSLACHPHTTPSVPILKANLKKCTYTCKFESYKVNEKIDLNNFFVKKYKKPYIINIITIPKES